MLALDQTTIYPVLPKAPDTPEGKAAIEKLDRERIAWTYWCVHQSDNVKQEES